MVNQLTSLWFAIINRIGIDKHSERQTNHAEDPLEGNSCGRENPAFAFVVTENNEEYICGVSSSSDPMMNVSINGIAQEVLTDSGSVSNLIGEEDLKRLKIAGTVDNKGLVAQHRQRCREEMQGQTSQQITWQQMSAWLSYFLRGS